MNRGGRFLLVLAIAASLTGVGCDKLRARDQLNKGVVAYKNAKYKDAIEHFKNAVDLDPNLTNARLYLATFAVEHANDHYGQMVLMLRMNGITPPGSTAQR